MRKHYATFAAVALAIGAFAVPHVRAQDDPSKGPAERTGAAIDNTARKAGDAMNRGISGTVAAPDAEAIRDTLAQVAEASVTKNGLNDVVERFVDADRNRLGKGDLKDYDKLNGIIDQFRKNWKAKYNQDFDIKDEDAVFNDQFAMIMQGEIGDGSAAARVAGERVPADPNAPAAPADDRNKIGGGDTNREPGRNVASVVIKESHGLQTVLVPMIHEMPDSWKLDVPDTLTSEQLRGNIENALTKCNEMQAQWPADVNDAYRHVTHQIVLAIEGAHSGALPAGMDKPMPGAGMGTDRPNQPGAPR